MLSLNFKGNKNNSLLFSSDLNFLNFEDYGFEPLVEKIKLDGFFTFDIQKSKNVASMIELDNRDYRIWKNH